jgi:hypothetical protein
MNMMGAGGWILARELMARLLLSIKLYEATDPCNGM